MVNHIKNHSFFWTSKGGNNESSIGANCHIYSYEYLEDGSSDQYGCDKIIVDCGSGSGDKGSWGYHRILADIIDDLKDADKIILTHAHGDHIEGLYYYVLSPLLTMRGGLEMGFDLPPIWGTPYTIEKTKQFFTTRLGRIIASKDISDEIKRDVQDRMERVIDQMKVFYPGNTILCGKNIHVTPIAMSHNTLHNVALLIQTPTATVFHSGDFNVDLTYKHPCLTDFDEIASLGEKGVDVALIDSTGADKNIKEVFEDEIAQNLESLVNQYPDKRIVMTTMGGHDQRLITLMDVARKTGRELQVAGEAMQLTFDVFKKLGLVPADLNLHYITRAGQEDRVARENAILVSTGSQGESKTPFVRSVMERGYPTIKLHPDKDVVIFSSSMLAINKPRYEPVLRALHKQGFTFYYPDNTHLTLNAHGHSRAPGKRKLLKALKPRFGIPIHGMLDGQEEGRKKGLLYYCGDIMNKLGILPLFVKNNQKVQLDHPNGPTIVEDNSLQHSWLGVHVFNQMRNRAEAYLITRTRPSEENERKKKTRYNIGRSFDHPI